MQLISGKFRHQAYLFLKKFSNSRHNCSKLCKNGEIYLTYNKSALGFYKIRAILCNKQLILRKNGVKIYKEIINYNSKLNAKNL